MTVHFTRRICQTFINFIISDLIKLDLGLEFWFRFCFILNVFRKAYANTMQLGQRLHNLEISDMSNVKKSI